MTTKYETREQAEERREQLILKAEREASTGYDILLENKKRYLNKLFDILKADPNLSRQQMADALKVSKRSVYRYLAELRRRYKKGIVVTSADIQMREKQERLKHLKRLLRVHPEYSREKLCHEIGVSKKTLYKYFNELEQV